MFLKEVEKTDVSLRSQRSQDEMTSIPSDLMKSDHRVCEILHVYVLKWWWNIHFLWIEGRWWTLNKRVNIRDPKALIIPHSPSNRLTFDTFTFSSRTATPLTYRVVSRWRGATNRDHFYENTLNLMKRRICDPIFFFVYLFIANVFSKLTFQETVNRIKTNGCSFFFPLKE